MTQQVFGAVGAAIGGYFFGAAGAQWGWAIGSAVGSLVDPTVIRGPTIGDMGRQTSQEGVPRPIVFGLSPPMAGNIISTSDPIIVRKRERQGKGGPKVVTESVYRIYAVRVCEGPITRYVRIWRNSVLVYDASDHPLLSLDDNNWFLRTGRLFLGGYSQLPSPDLEIVTGFGTTPAYRGTAYMVMANEDLTDLRGAIPQWMFQVERCEGLNLTSRVYPIESVDAMQTTAEVREAPHVLESEAMETTGSVLSGELREILYVYSGPPEALETNGEIAAGELREVLLRYDDGLPEALETSGQITSGTLEDVLIRYEEGAPEALETTGSIIAGSLE